MRLPVRRLLIATMTATLAVSLAACQSDPDVPEPQPAPTGVASGLVPGACIASSGDPSILGDTPVTEDAIVDCGEEHVYEVLAAQDIPGRYLASTEATEEDRVRLQAGLDGARTEPVQITFAAFARAYCDIALQRALGLDGGTELAGTDIASLQVIPISHTSAPYAVLPVDGWTDQPSLLCVNRFVEESATPDEAPVAPVTGPTTVSLLSSERPLSQRLCFSFDAAGLPADTSCESVHDAEYTVSFDATPMLDDEQLAAASADPAGPFPGDVQELLDQACNDVLGLVIGDDRDESVIGQALRGDEGWGTGGLSNAVTCFATPQDEAQALPSGSVFGLGDAPIELVARD
ncbi:hypothetical protein [Aeromicrobium sp. Leaf350]|uniref:hypothetical protein n=1 Tax=Aeromicrobium sp. Leaf350 TaxID=2876565 RepID=UPI001E40DD50|nr:hypothetical protein [Aeromicrobium sp. Leaf350]